MREAGAGPPRGAARGCAARAGARVGSRGGAGGFPRGRAAAAGRERWPRPAAGRRGRASHRAPGPPLEARGAGRLAGPSPPAGPRHRRPRGEPGGVFLPKGDETRYQNRGSPYPSRSSSQLMCLRSDEPTIKKIDCLTTQFVLG